MASSLLKQIAWPPEEDRAHLKIIYEKITRTGDRPNRDAILKLFVDCAQYVKNRLRVLFDALDECSDDELGCVYGIIDRLRRANIGVYVTTRPHLVDVLREQKCFADATYMENVTANELDIRLYLRKRLLEHRKPIGEDFNEEILNKIGNAEGM